MDVTLEEEYFKWLYSHIGDEDAPYTFWKLALQLHKKEFVWFVPNDDNRIEDGRELRYEFSYETGKSLTPEWHSFGVSMFEMLIALSRRLAFQLDDSERNCFFTLLANIELVTYHDKKYSGTVKRIVDETLERVIWRTYSYSGEGGLFPLDDPHRDQRKVEIWYQMSAYVIERL